MRLSKFKSRRAADQRGGALFVAVLRLERTRRQFFECSRGTRRKENSDAEGGNEDRRPDRDRKRIREWREERRSKTIRANTGHPQARRKIHEGRTHREHKRAPTMQVQLYGSVHSLGFCDPLYAVVKRRAKLPVIG